jgi:hypothetical protein
VKAFDATYGAKFPKAVAKITDDLDQLLAFHDFPAEHWVHFSSEMHPVLDSTESWSTRPPKPAADGVKLRGRGRSCGMF